MPWYSLFHPSLLDPAVIKYIKEKWHFNRKPLLVVMDSQGRIVNTNALHMLWTWGSVAFPFTSPKEEALWCCETWRVELLVDVDSIPKPKISNWVHLTYISFFTLWHFFSKKPKWSLGYFYHFSLKKTFCI
ncbi:putative protein SIEVE ELEMENT OCCLUSION [Helianthus annuus]|nr:putative protein SIEVE ELEMENT OCCLUSION [Helianthus annuus]